MSAPTTTTQPQLKVTLHWLEVSRSHRILWLLEELQIPYDLKTYKRGKDKLAPPALKTVHPLGKSPVITIDNIPGRDASDPLVLIESGAIVEYLCDYFGKWLVPKRYPAGIREGEGKIGDDTEEFLRYRTFMHYAEGSIMPFMVMSLVASTIKERWVPWPISIVTHKVADGIHDSFLKPNYDVHFKWIESQLATAPNGGKYLCGENLTAADVLMSFPLEAGRERTGLTEKDCPHLWAYVDRLHEREAWKRATQKIIEIEGSFKDFL